MDEERYKEWIECSFALSQVEMLIMHRSEGLGLLDADLIEDFKKLKINPSSEEERRDKLRHIIKSYLWVLGAYELVRLINSLTSKRTAQFKESTLNKIKEVLSIFTEVRMPLTKFQERGKYNNYSGVYTNEFDSIKGAGWKIYTFGKREVITKCIYRIDLSNLLLDLLKNIKEQSKMS